MLTEAAIPVLAGLFLQISSPMNALMIASFLPHDMTAPVDVSYAVTAQQVTPSNNMCTAISRWCR
jgi:hypothetical protein